MLRKSLLASGIAASLLYVGIDLLAAILNPEYHSFTSRAISELMANGAPTEAWVDPLFLLYDVLMIAFAVGVWRADSRKRARIASGVFCAYATLGLLGPTLFEMNVRGSGESAADLLHIGLTAVMVALIFASVVLGSSLLGRSFRIYSWTTVLIMLASGIATSFAVRGLASGEPTPWLGILERINIGAYLLWVVVLASALLRGGGGPGTADGRTPAVRSRPFAPQGSTTRPSR